MHGTVRRLCNHCGTPLTRKQVTCCYIHCSVACSRATRRTSGVWNTVRTAELTKLWNEGASAGIIARTLKKGATRSSVIGKVKRLGLKGRGGMVRNSERIAAFQQPSMPLQFKPKITQGPIPDKLISRPKINAKPLPLPPDLPVPDGSKTFMEVGPIGRECRYPYGDPHDLSTFRFCAKPAHGSWCGEHNIWERR